LVGPKNTPVDQCENAVVEEVGSGGLRIRAGSHLNEEDSLFLYVGDNRKPVRAKVVWVRKDGLIEKRKTGKTGQAFIAGCKVRGTAASAKPREAARSGDSGDLAARLFRWGLVAGGLGFSAVIVYILVMLLQMVKSA